MKIESIKDLEKVIRLCRKTGVTDISIDGVVLKLGDAEVLHQPEAATGPELKSEETLTDEQLLMWSVNGQNN